MRVATSCARTAIDIKMSGRSPELHNRKQMEKLTKHVASCKECQLLAGVRIPEDKEPSASPTDDSDRASESDSVRPTTDDNGPRTNIDQCTDSAGGPVDCHYHATGGPIDQPCGSDGAHCTGSGATCPVHGGYCRVRDWDDPDVIGYK